MTEKLSRKAAMMQTFAEVYGMGDVKVGLITGQYPNKPQPKAPQEKERK